MGKSVELDEEGLPIPQKVKVAKASNDFDDEGLPIPKKKTSSSNIYTNPSDLLQKALSGGGQAGTSAVPSVGVNKKAVLEYMYHSKTPEQKSYAQATPENSRKLAYNQGRKKLQEIVDQGSKDPIASVRDNISKTTDTQDALKNYMAQRVLEDEIDGVDAKNIISTTPHLSEKDNQTGQLLKKKVDEYDKIATPFRDLKNVNYQDERDFGSRWRIYDAAIKAFANKNPTFKKEAEATGIDFNGNDLVLKFGEHNAKLGHIISNVLADPDFKTFIGKENPDLLPSMNKISNDLIYDNKDFGKNVMANQISQAIEKSGYNEIDPVFNFAEGVKKMGDIEAKSLFSDDPRKLQFYNEHKDEILNKLDAPSFFEGFGTTAKGMIGDTKKTFTTLFTPTSKSVEDKWDKEANHVSAEPKGFNSWLRDVGGVTGLVATIGATGNLTGISNPANANTAATVLNFFGHEVEAKKAEYPDRPVTAITLGATNTLLYALLAKDIFPAAKVKSAFNAVQPEIKNTVESFTSGKISLEAARKDLQTTFKKATDFVGGTLTKNAKTSLEIAGITGVNQLLDKLAGMSDERFDEVHPDGELANTAIHTFKTFAPISALGKFGEMKNRNRVMEETIYDAVSNPQRTERMINEAGINLSFGTVNEIKDNFKVALDAKKELDALKIHPKEQKRFIFEALKEKAAKDQAEASNDPVIQKKNKDIIKESQEIKERILNGEDADTIVTEREQKEIDEKKDNEVKLQRLEEDNKIDNEKFDAARKGLDGRNPEDRMKIAEIEKNRKRANEDFEKDASKLKPKEEPAITIEQEKIESSGDEVILNKIQENATGSEKGHDLQYYIDKVGEAPLAAKKYGEGVSEELIKRVPTEKLQANYDFLIKIDPESKEADAIAKELDKREVGNQPTIDQDRELDDGTTMKEDVTAKVVMPEENTKPNIVELKTTTDEAKPNIEEVTETVEPIPSKESEPPTGTPPETGSTTKEGKEGIGITHADTKEIREEKGLPEYDKEVQTVDAWDADAVKRIKNGEMSALLDKMKRGESISEVEQMMMGRHIANLDAELTKNPSKENLDKLNEAVQLSDKVGGSAWGRAGRARQESFLPDDSLGTFLMGKQEAQGTKLSEKQVKEETEKFTELKKAKEALAELEAADKEAYSKLVAEIGVNKAKAAARKASKKTKEEHIADRKAIVDKAKAALKKLREDGSLKSSIPGFAELKGLKAIAPHVKEYMRDLLNEGVDKFDNIVSAIHAEFKDVLDNLTKSNVVDILAGEHDEVKEQTRNEKANSLRLVQREAKLIKELADARKGVEKAKNQDQINEKNRRIEELQEKIKEVKRINKEKNAETDPVEDLSAGSGEALDKEIKRLEAKAKKLANDIKDKKYLEEKPKPIVFKKSRKAQILEDRVIDLENKIRHERSKDEYNKRSKWRKGFDKFMEIIGIRRLVQSSLDMSVPFRQGATLLSPRRIDVWAKSFKANLQSIFNPKKFERIMYAIRQDPMYHDMVKDRVTFNDLGSADPNLHNEDFRKSFIYKIPILSEPLKASNRSADAFLNVARYEMYKKMRKTLEDKGLTRESDPKAFTYMGNWVMSMTGRGNMMKMIENTQARNFLGNTFYGARLMASRFNILNPVTYFDPRVPREAKVEAMKDLASFSVTMMVTGMALAAAGGKISLNPDDSNFLQIKFGKKTYDISGGLSNYVRTFLRVAKAGYTKATGTKYEGNKATDNAGMSVLNFLRNKLSPNTAYATDAFFGKAYGQDFDPSEIYRIYPMYTDDVLKSLKDEGVMAIPTVLLPNILGIGYGNYAGKGQIDPDIEELLKRNMRSDEMNSEKIKNFNKDGAPVVTREEFEKFADQRDAEIQKGIERLFNKGALVIEDGDIKLKPYKELTQEQVVAETTAIKANATRKVKKALFGEKEEDPDEQALEKELRLQKKEMFPDEFDENE